MFRRLTERGVLGGGRGEQRSRPDLKNQKYLQYTVFRCFRNLKTRKTCNTQRFVASAETDMLARTVPVTDGPSG